MGACDFITVARGKSAKEAFQRAVGDAAYEHGHGGYTGTIAEKRDFVMIPYAVPDDVSDIDAARFASTFARNLINDGDPRIDDKWGPAGCIKLVGENYLFFGWAGS